LFIKFSDENERTTSGAARRRTREPIVFRFCPFSTKFLAAETRTVNNRNGFVVERFPYVHRSGVRVVNTGPKKSNSSAAAAAGRRTVDNSGVFAKFPFPAT